ncbi:MAG: DUF58 domain-containing protein [Planctomycetota bacterium]
MNQPEVDPRVYASIDDLVRMRSMIGGLSFRSRQPANSLLSGRHGSRIRGRGLNFEEVRPYHPGDDVRTIDWKVTARTRSPHTRVYNEERDRPALLLIDQRASMFFGSTRYMKSVTASHVSALAAWRVLDQGDRVGAIIFNDELCETHPPKRSDHHVVRILTRMTQLNRSLTATTPGVGAPMLSSALEKAERLAHHGFLVVIISDFIGLNEIAQRSLRRLAHHNDLIGIAIHDPIASKLPDSTRMVVSNGELQTEIRPGKLAKDLRSATTQRLAVVLSLQRKLRAPMLPISTAEEVLPQLLRLLGQA